MQWGQVEEPPVDTKDGSAPAAAPKTKPRPLVHINQLVTEPQFLALAEKFQTVVQQGNYVEFCREKVPCLHQMQV